MFTHKKAQIEMIGLAIIVILLALGMFFVAKFSLSSDTGNEVQQGRQQQISSQFLNTLMSTSAGCTGSAATFTALLQEYGSEATNLNCEGGLETYFRTSVKQIFNQTLDVWQYRYNLTVTFPPQANKEPISEGPGCTRYDNSKTQYFFIPTDYSKSIVLELKLC